MKTFLVLEDEPLIAMDVRYAFEDAGAAAITAATCEQAMEALAEHEFSGAVLDVNLGNGHTCEKAAVELKRRGIPFALLTGDLDRSGEFLRGLHAPVLSKPRSADEVVRYMLALIESEAAAPSYSA